MIAKTIDIAEQSAYALVMSRVERWLGGNNRSTKITRTTTKILLVIFCGIPWHPNTRAARVRTPAWIVFDFVRRAEKLINPLFRKVSASWSYSGKLEPSCFPIINLSVGF